MPQALDPSVGARRREAAGVDEATHEIMPRTGMRG